MGMLVEGERIARALRGTHGAEQAHAAADWIDRAVLVFAAMAVPPAEALESAERKVDRLVKEICEDDGISTADARELVLLYARDMVLTSAANK